MESQKVIMIPTKKEQQKYLKKLSKKQLIEQVMIARELWSNISSDLHAERVVHNINEQALKSAEYALVYKDKEIEHKDRLLSALIKS